jgi:hypothetical protein
LYAWYFRWNPIESHLDSFHAHENPLPTNLILTHRIIVASAVAGPWLQLLRGSERPTSVFILPDCPSHNKSDERAFPLQNDSGEQARSSLLHRSCGLGKFQHSHALSGLPGVGVGDFGGGGGVCVCVCESECVFAFCMQLHVFVFVRGVTG